jgi:hypothetical protein
MNKLPKEKRDHLILVGMGTVAVLSLIIYGLIRPQYATVKQINNQIAAARDELQSKKDTIKTANTVSNQLAELTNTLAMAESDMAFGDPAVWIYDTIRNFKEHYNNVDISVKSALTPGSVDLLPRFPYQQIKVTVGGTAYFHDLGKFIADFENTYPHARIVNLTVQSDVGGGDNEKLAFSMDVIALVKTTGPQS